MKKHNILLTITILSFIVLANCGDKKPELKQSTEDIEITEENALEEAEKLIQELNSL